MEQLTQEIKQLILQSPLLEEVSLRTDFLRKLETLSPEDLKKVKSILEKSIQAKKDFEAKKVQLLKEKLIKIKALYAKDHARLIIQREAKNKENEEILLDSLEHELESIEINNTTTPPQ